MFLCLANCKMNQRQSGPKPIAKQTDWHLCLAYAYVDVNVAVSVSFFRLAMFTIAPSPIALNRLLAIS